MIEILPASPIAWISLSATKALYNWMPMALSDSLCVEIDMVSINSLLTLLMPELGAKMISGNLEQISAFVYSKRSLSPDFNAMLISLIDSISCFAFSESLFFDVVDGFDYVYPDAVKVNGFFLFHVPRILSSYDNPISCHDVWLTIHEIKRSSLLALCAR